LLQLVYCIEADPNRRALGTKEILEMVLRFVGRRFGAALVRALLVNRNGPLGEELAWRGFALPKQQEFRKTLLGAREVFVAPRGTPTL